MLQEPMMEKLLAMRLHGMADALKTQEQDPGARELSFLERLALLVDHQWNWRQNQALARRLHGAKLRSNACVEEIDYRAAPVWARVSSPAHWHRKLAATGTRHCTLGRRRCFAIWQWLVPTAVCDY